MTWFEVEKEWQKGIDMMNTSYNELFNTFEVNKDTLWEIRKNLPQNMDKGYNYFMEEISIFFKSFINTSGIDDIPSKSCFKESMYRSQYIKLINEYATKFIIFCNTAKNYCLSYPNFIFVLNNLKSKTELLLKSINDTLQFWGTLYEDPTKLGNYDF